MHDQTNDTTGRIVVGADGSSGSVSPHGVQHAPCPVVVLPQERES